MSKKEVLIFLSEARRDNVFNKVMHEKLVYRAEKIDSSLPNVEASRVSENEQQRNVCINTECHANDFSECNLKAGSCEDRQT